MTAGSWPGGEGLGWGGPAEERRAWDEKGIPEVEEVRQGWEIIRLIWKEIRIRTQGPQVQVQLCSLRTSVTLVRSPL